MNYITLIFVFLLSTSSLATVYGENSLTRISKSRDDLQELSTAVGMTIEKISFNSESGMSELPPSRQPQNLCASAYFGTTSRGSCNVFLIAPNLALTPKYCLPEEKCHATSIIFNAEENIQTNRLYVKNEDIYRCETVTPLSDNKTVMVKLNRNVNAHKFFNIKVYEKNQQPNSVQTIGSPMASVLHSSTGGIIFSANNDTIESNLDFIQGMAGSPLLDEHLNVIGINSSGDSDFVFNHSNGCFDHKVCTSDAKNCIKSSSDTITEQLLFDIQSLVTF